MNPLTKNPDVQIIANKPERKSLPTKNFIKLEAWKKCKEIKSVFYMEIIPSLPAHKQDNLGNLMKNAAISITTDYLPYNTKVSSNYGKIDYRKDAKFFRIIRFSLSQLKNYITLCKDLNYIDNDLYNKGILLLENTKTLLNRYIYFLSRY